jgi:hypothetical protein
MAIRYALSGEMRYWWSVQCGKTNPTKTHLQIISIFVRQTRRAGVFDIAQENLLNKLWLLS